MGRVTATSTVFVPFYITYRCSKCGNVNLVEQVVSEQRNDSQYGTLPTKNNVEKMEETASKYSKAAMGRRLTKIFEELKINRYRSAKFNVCCPKCKNKEPWSKLRYSKIEAVFGALIPFVFIISIVLLLSKDYLGLIYIAGGFVSLLCLWFFIKYLHRMVMENHIAKLPEESLPIIAMSKTEILEMARNQFRGA